jgi:hypothetical protein
VAVSLAYHNDTEISGVVANMNNAAAALSRTPDDISDQVSQQLGTWSEHVLSWVDGAPFDVHVVRYEDCLSDAVGAFSAAFAAAGFDLEGAEMELAVERSSFPRLSSYERSDGFPEARSRSSPFFRRGEAGSWRHHLPADLVERLEAAHGKVMQRFGYLG